MGLQSMGTLAEGVGIGDGIVDLNFNYQYIFKS